MKISLAIITWNEAEIIREALEHIASLRDIHDIVITDGGSTDATVTIIKEFIHKNVFDVPITLIEKNNISRGQGFWHASQKVRGDVILFLHIDSKIEQVNINEIIRVIDLGYDMGAFRLTFKYHPHKIWYSGIELFVRLRAKYFKMFHGDQGMFVTRKFLKEIGGYPRISLMEDVKLSQLGRQQGRMYASKVPIWADPRKIKNNGFFKMVFLYFYLKTLYYLGYDLDYITKTYRALK